MKRSRPWCVVIADKIVARYSGEQRANREMERMRELCRNGTGRKDYRVAYIPVRPSQPSSGVGSDGSRTTEKK